MNKGIMQDKLQGRCEENVVQIITTLKKNQASFILGWLQILDG